MEYPVKKSHCAVIVYHKNASSIYKKEWLDRFVKSIQSQTYQNFDIYELNYGGGDERLFPESDRNIFIKKVMPTFVDGMNFLLNKIFRECEYQYCFNTNVDDYYSPFRFERQLAYMQYGVALCSSNITYINEHDSPLRNINFSKVNVRAELRKGHNVIAHPVVCYSRKFWISCTGYDPRNIPQEDLRLWQSTARIHKFAIVPETLCYYRIHENSVCQNSNSR